MTVLLIGSLFILLAARLQVSDLAYVNVASLAFLAVLFVVARPAAVFLSTLGSELSHQERVFLSCMAPRGIVAAAVSSILGLRLAEAGHLEAERLVPLTFMVIIGTVGIYGLAASPVARWLRVAKPNPQGVVIVGAHPFARSIASALKAEGYQVLLVDTNRGDISAARMAGLPTFYASILSDFILDEIELGGIGRLLALTSNDKVNSLAALHFAGIFGRAEVYQLPPEREGDGRREAVPQHLRGRLVFGLDAIHSYLAARLSAGAVIKTTKLTQEFEYETFRSLYGEAAIPLFLVKESGDLVVFTADNAPTPKPGQTLISLVDPTDETPTKA